MPQDDRTTPVSIEKIRQNNGQDGKRTWVGLNGFVFDVTGSPSYQEGGSYANFAGRDITMAAAHYSTDDTYLDHVYDPENSKLDFNQQQNVM